MRTIRRLYLYAVSFAILQVIVWGLVGLARSAFSLEQAGSASRMAQSLSLTLVGLPLFWFHWRRAQREARRDPEEAGSFTRLAFIYAGLLITLIPMVQNILALANRLAFSLFHLEPGLAFIGSQQTWSDNLAAVAVNALVAAYFFSLRRQTRISSSSTDPFTVIRHGYHYVWMFYALGLTLLGVQQITRSILYVPNGLGGNSGYPMANGLVFLLVGLPIWLWRLRDEEELTTRRNEPDRPHRLVVLYLLAFSGLGAALISTGLVMAAALGWIMGEATSLTSAFHAVGQPISIGLPMAGVWFFYGQRLRLETGSISSSLLQPRFHRLFSYILAGLGFGVTLAGLSLLAAFLAQASLANLVGEGLLRRQLALALAVLAVGLPLWWLTWRPMQLDALLPGPTGERNRHYLVRKGYLYLMLVLGLIGIVLSVRGLITQVIESLMKIQPAGFTLPGIYWLGSLALVAIWSGYHGLVLREDGRQTNQEASSRHALFPVILLDPGDGRFGQELLVALREQAPRLPVVIQNLDQGVPGEDLANAKAVILPAHLAMQPTEALRVWLQEFRGQRLVAAFPTPGWRWLGSEQPSCREMAEQAARTLRRMAEGEVDG